jgi:hypothetical protein
MSTASAITPVPIKTIGVRPSVPALKPWAVLVTNSGTLSRCTRFHNRSGSHRRTSDVSSIAASR